MNGECSIGIGSKGRATSIEIRESECDGRNEQAELVDKRRTTTTVEGILLEERRRR